MSLNRRTFVKGAMATGAAAVAVNAGLLMPNSVLAALSNEAAHAKTVADATKSLFGSADAAENAKIELKAPAVAENGAVVPVTVDANALGNVESIAIMADKNPAALAAVFNYGAGANGYISIRLRMGETMNAIAVVKAGGKLYSAQTQVKVTIGGCGG